MLQNQINYMIEILKYCDFFLFVAPNLIYVISIWWKNPLNSLNRNKDNQNGYNIRISWNFLNSFCNLVKNLHLQSIFMCVVIFFLVY